MKLKWRMNLARVSRKSKMNEFRMSKGLKGNGEEHIISENLPDNPCGRVWILQGSRHSSSISPLIFPLTLLHIVLYYKFKKLLNPSPNLFSQQREYPQINVVYFLKTF